MSMKLNSPSIRSASIDLIGEKFDDDVAGDFEYLLLKPGDAPFDFLLPEDPGVVALDLFMKLDHEFEAGVTLEDFDVEATGVPRINIFHLSEMEVLNFVQLYLAFGILWVEEVADSPSYLPCWPPKPSSGRHHRRSSRPVTWEPWEGALYSLQGEAEVLDSLPVGALTSAEAEDYLA